MNKTLLTILKASVLGAIVLMAVSCAAYDGKVTDPSTGESATGQEITFNHNRWVEGKQNDFNENTRAIEALLAQNAQIEIDVQVRSGEVDEAIDAANTELQNRVDLIGGAIDFGSTYAVDAVPGAAPLIDFVKPFLLGGLLSGAGSAAVTRRRSLYTGAQQVASVVNAGRAADTEFDGKFATVTGSAMKARLVNQHPVVQKAVADTKL